MAIKIITANEDVGATVEYRPVYIVASQIVVIAPRTSGSKGAMIYTTGRTLTVTNDVFELLSQMEAV